MDKSPVQLLEELQAAQPALHAQIASLTKAGEEYAAKIGALEADVAKKATELADSVQANAALSVELSKAQADLVAANETISGKAFRHVAGAKLDEAATVAGGGEAGESKKPFATKADALREYAAICKDAKAAQDFRRQHWAILGLSKPA